MIKMLKNKLKEEKGLTLIELLAVIVILGIIAAIAIPTISGIIDKSKNDAKVAEALQILDAARLAYTDDNSKTSWVYNSTAATGDKEPLSKYISKVKDKDFTVNYIPSTNSFTITGHESAPVVKSTYDDDDAVTEDELAKAAR